MATLLFIVLNPLFVDVMLIAPSSTLLYFEMSPPQESSRTPFLKSVAAKFEFVCFVIIAAISFAT